MARPERHDVDYFPFYVKRGKTLNILQAKYGLEGMGFFTQLCRFLAITPDHHYQILNPIDRMNFFAEIGMKDEGVGMEILDLFATTGKIDRLLWTEKKVICSQDFIESLTDAYDRRTNDIITIEAIREHYGVKVSENDEINDSNPHTTALPSEINDSNPQTKLKESKVNNKELIISEQFEIFWNEYPKKVSKGQAVKTYSAMIKKGADSEKILSCLEAYIHEIEMTRKDIQYVKNPSTFLNNYLDYVPPVPKPPTVFQKVALSVCPACGGKLVAGACMGCYTNYDVSGSVV